MAKQINLSVSEELAEKMEKWKDSFDFSRIFQNAISEAIRKKESFQIRDVVARLKKEKGELEGIYYEKGKTDGLEWVKAANLAEFQYALDYVPMDYKNEVIIAYDPTHDEVLGYYFNDVIKADDKMGFVETSFSNSVPNEYFRAWERGWSDAVHEFWEEIKSRM
jgi:hypothetical protein